jgi:hypothetical protein
MGYNVCGVWQAFLCGRCAERMFSCKVYKEEVMNGDYSKSTESEFAYLATLGQG